MPAFEPMAATITSGAQVSPSGVKGPPGGSGVPAGVVADFGGAVPPGGWLFCYGQAISRTGFAKLFAAIGTAWGAGNGATTFNVPDLRGRICAGLDNMGGTSANRLTSPLNGGTLGAAGGEENHVLSVAEMGAHNHSEYTVANQTNNYWAIPNGALLQIYAGYYGTSVGGGGAHNNVQPTAITTKIIATGF